MKTNFITQRTYTRSTGLKNTFGDFVCLNCGSFVCADEALSGVHHRNHCPYCLASRHLDLFDAGDRLSACKGVMLPVALTWKRSLKKYARPGDGELMLVHRCRECGGLSLNRIAADDDNHHILALLRSSVAPEDSFRETCRAAGIQVLDITETHLVMRCLFGQN